VREIYGKRRAKHEAVAVVGDLNDSPDRDPLAPLIGQGSDLRDISRHPSFQRDGRPGTHGNGTAGSKIDYILLSPVLFDKVTSGGVFRKGVWGGKNGTLWPIFPEMTAPEHAASDHAALWAEIDL
jgi:endonuclease/exonuclease/phosphatase family metal-dependent hydrolase